MAKNTRERFIDQVASIVSERVRQTRGAISFEDAVEDAKKINDSDNGFTFDLRDPGQRENNWSRYENVSLDEQEMEKAIDEARKLIG